ncbi:MAG: hypothetical protein IPK04_20555 [Bdellovibrionales bacterium]|jgi:hypothetical protein|nr:hypothetical protein [Bdellovibrionales bacterium]
MKYDSEIQSSIDYLHSNRALEAVDSDAYWPKWHSPWWHMLLLHEMGETKRIPKEMIRRYVASLNRLPLKIFPIQPEDMPEGVDPYRESPCHCQLGNVYQVLSAWGVDVDKEAPWIRPWFLRYQMADGGLNCDNDAYLVKDECPSSMVGTISVFEAVLLHTPRPWTREEKHFLDKGAKFLMDRKLMLGSSTKHNASERKSAEQWTKLCFPRFYLYDVLRGLSALALWAEKTNQSIPKESISDATNFLSQYFPDGNVKIGRHSFEGVGTLLPSPTGEWIRKQPATFFPLLERVSEIGSVSPFLSKQWSETKQRILSHSEIGPL